MTKVLATPECFQRFLVATDFSPASKRAFRRGVAMARAAAAEVHLLHVHTAPSPRAVFFISVSPRSRETISLRLQGKVRKRFHDFLRGEDLTGVRVVTALREGRPHQEILGYAEREGVDLIVVGERHETRAQHLLQHLAFESVGERVRREARCSVLTVR